MKQEKIGGLGLNNNTKETNKLLPIIVCAIIILLPICIFLKSSINNIENSKEGFNNDNSDFTILSSQENKNVEETIKQYAKSKGYKIKFDYAGTLEITSKINRGEAYDAVWLSNSIWSYMFNSNVKYTDAKSTSINPIVFGIKKSKAQELGFVDKDIYTKDIVQAISDGKLKFSMANPTVTNSGASAYLGMLSTLAGNPEVLTKEMLNDENLKNSIKTLFSGMERSSGDEDFLEELFLNGDYEAVFAYESSIISINQKLISSGEEPLYAVYPIDGVSISDSPFGYVGNAKNLKKKQIFNDILSYILSNEGQAALQKFGKRTWFGGINNNVDKNLFNPDWGIDTTKYISPIKYPSTEVIKIALNLYQTELRKPIHVVFCLDYSGSMRGEGYQQLVNAMEYILTDQAATDFIQFSDKDKIDIIPFSDDANILWSDTGSSEGMKNLLEKIKGHKVEGNTALYPSCEKAISRLTSEDSDQYNLSIVVMTDGQGNRGKYYELSNTYNNAKNKVPIYSIMFGDANEKQLNEIASLSNGKVFDGKTNLVEAFKEVRGYN